MKTVFACLCLSLALLAQDGASTSSADLQLGRQILELLKTRDADGLVELLDGPGFHAEGEARGDLVHTWDAATEEQREQALRHAVGDWIRDGAQYFWHATLADVRELPDPDAGRGPNPQRRYLNVLASQPGRSRFREVLVMLGDDGGVVQLTLGPEFGDAATPAGEAQLLPTPLPRLTSDSLTWPDDVDNADRRDARAWVAQLDDAATRLDAQDELFSWPHAAVPALLEAAHAWLEGSDAAPRNVQLVALTLEQLTGRPLALSSDLARSETSLAAWMAWHRKHAEDFEPLDLPDDLLAALDARDGGDDTDALSRWEALLAAQQAEAAGGPPAVAPAEPESAPEPASGGTPTPPVPVPGRAPALPIPAPRATPAVPSSAGAPAKPTAGASPAHAALPPELNALEVLFDGELVLYPELHEELDSARRDVLRVWAADIDRLGLRVALGERTEHIVLGEVSDALLLSSAEQLDITAELMEPLIPDVAPGPLKTTLVLLFDSQTARDDHQWGRILDTLVKRRVLFEGSANQLRREPGGLTLRSFPFVIQPTWDMAGNAAAGDDEFRLANELAHKLTVCMLSNRAGQLPPGLRWALAHFAEVALQGTVYQFNRTGFVSTDDHFDWERKADRWLDKRGKKRGFSFPELIFDAGRDNPLLENSVLVWSLVDYYCHERPEDWITLLELLAGLQAEKDSYGVATTWLPDKAATLDLLEAQLAELKASAVARHIDTH
ncbi:MAG: hypothetical protein DHS20C15_02890 [Planctomycetota bacterium]|nr:MAG: hypothetical protein DHS20C15_02890 [Planctomycetota bacterium]